MRAETEAEVEKAQVSLRAALRKEKDDALQAQREALLAVTQAQLKSAHSREKQQTIELVRKQSTALAAADREEMRWAALHNSNTAPSPATPSNRP